MFTTASSTQLVATGFTSFSVAALTILGIFLGISVALLVFYFGARKIGQSVGVSGITDFDISVYRTRKALEMQKKKYPPYM